MPLDSAQERPAGLLTLDVACHLYGIPRPLFDEHTARGDAPALQVIAGEVVVNARHFAAWAALTKAEAAGGCSWCD